MPPNIEGVYEVEISSNWPLIEARLNGRPAPLGEAERRLKRMGTAKITSRMSRLDIDLEMDDKYLRSEIVSAALIRKPGTRMHEIAYVYECTVTEPVEGDTGHFRGTGVISVPKERCPDTFSGNYWTDRLWHEGKNTAGEVVFRRSY